MKKNLRYNVIIRKYKNDIYNYSLYMLREKMDADDATQEVFIKIWYNFEKINVFSIKAWIIKITHNLCIDYLRKRKRKMMLENSLDNQDGMNLMDKSYESNPANTTNLNLISNDIQKEIFKLPEQLKSIFVLYELNGMKYKEISRALNIPINSVKVYLFRARKKLQAQLSEHKLKEVLCDD